MPKLLKMRSNVVNNLVANDSIKLIGNARHSQSEIQRERERETDRISLLYLNQ